MTKPKIAFNWASSCGGCEIAIFELGTKLVELSNKVDVVFWPAIFDYKYTDLEAMPDKSIDVTFFNGAIRNSENEDVAKLLRAKSKMLVAFGACAYGGGIPALANTTTRAEIFTSSYQETQTTNNPEKIIPRTKVEMREGVLTIPEFYNTVKTLDQTVDVDYYVPGCPPVGAQVEKVLNQFVDGNLPPKGAVLGASDKSLCHECKRIKADRKITKLVRSYQTIADPEKCTRTRHYVHGSGNSRRLRRHMPRCECRMPWMLRSSAKRGRSRREDALCISISFRNGKRGGDAETRGFRGRSNWNILPV